jgi:thioredoxin 2
MAEIVTCSNCGKRNRLPAAARGVARCAACHTALPWLTAAGDDDFDEVVTAASLPVPVDLWAPWCGPCRIVAPHLEELAGEREDLQIVKLNVDDNPQTAARYGVMSIPTLLLFKHGQLAHQIIGALPKSRLVQEIEPALAA